MNANLKLAVSFAAGATMVGAMAIRQISQRDLLINTLMVSNRELFEVASVLSNTVEETVLEEIRTNVKFKHITEQFDKEAS